MKKARTVLDRYRFEDELDAGPISAVYRAREIATGRSVVIKLTPAAALSSARPLQHRVTGFVQGSDLRAHTCTSNLLPLGTTLSIVARVADALSRIHAEGRVHGDVKPANIIFDAVGDRISLIDLPETCDVPGTRAFLSPERICGMPASAASDQFALGVTLYQLACGGLPFAGVSWPQIAYRVAHEPHAALRNYAPHVPAQLDAVIDQMLAKDPRARYRDLATVGRALRRLSADLQDSAAVSKYGR